MLKMKAFKSISPQGFADEFNKMQGYVHSWSYTPTADGKGVGFIAFEPIEIEEDSPKEESREKTPEEQEASRKRIEENARRGVTIVPLRKKQGGGW